MYKLPWNSLSDFSEIIPKIVKNAYLRIAIFKISPGEHAPGPPRGDEGRPSPWSLRDHKFWGLRIPRPPPPPPPVTQILDPPLRWNQRQSERFYQSCAESLEVAFTLRLFLRTKARRVIYASLYKMIRVKKCETTRFEPGKSCPGFLYVTLHCWPCFILQRQAFEN